jgi:cytochrome P450
MVCPFDASYHIRVEIATETTASAITATLILLAIHQEEQEKAYGEILQFYASSESKVYQFIVIKKFFNKFLPAIFLHSN